MNASIDISIIIVNWNTKDFLMECLHSLEACSSVYWQEIIVVDNASIDDSVQMIKEHFPYVRIIQNEKNLGFAKANNIGIRQSSGRYICLVNSDVQVLPGCLAELTSHMDQDTAIGIIGPKILWPDMTLQDSCRKFPNLWNNLCEFLFLNRLFPRSDRFSGEHMMFFNHTTMRDVDGLAGCFLMIRKEALEQVGLFDERFFIYSEETDLCKRIKETHWKVVFFPDAQAIHYLGKSSSQDQARFSFEQVKSKMKYWEKHHKGFAATIFLLILLMHHGIRLVSESYFYLIAPSKRGQIGQQLTKTMSSLKYIFTRKHCDGRASVG